VDNEPYFVVIGTGPSAFASLLRLSKTGKKIVILDIGSKLETQQQIKKMNLIFDESKPHNLYNDEWADLLLSNQRKKDYFSPKKIFSSSYPYSNFMSLKIINKNKPSLELPISCGYGGFSSVWGATFNRYPNSVLKKWKKELNVDLESEYDEIEKKVTHLNNTHRHKDFASLFSTENEDLSKHKFTFDFQDSIVAINASSSENKCKNCNFCLFGCPYNSIFNSGHEISKLIKDNKNIELKLGALVKQIIPNEKNVQINFFNFSTGTIEKIYTKHVFIGAGAISTSIIVLNSFKEIKTIEIQDSAMMYSASILKKSIKKLKFDNSLTKISLSLKLYSQNDTYAQIYNYSAGIFEPILNSVKLSKKLKKFIDNIFCNKIILVISYLDSKVSNSIILTKLNDDVIESSVKYNQQQKKILKIHLKSIKKIFSARGFLSSSHIKMYKKTGFGVHIGANFSPYRLDLNKTDSKFGTLSSSKFIHIIDSSVLPEIKSGPITLTIMANSLRITNNVCENL
jgi:hypothetical protein